jgi:integrase
MACLVKDRTGRTKFWYCAFTTADGRRLKKSTKQTDRTKAWEVCVAMVNAEGAIASGSATERQLRKVINQALETVGERRLPDPTIEELLDNWIAEKAGAVNAATLQSYRSARKRLLDFLRPAAKGNLRSLTKQRVVEFRNHLATEGRTPATVNKILKHCLAGAFESARKEGLIDFNPFVAVDPLKEKRLKKDTFTPEQVTELLSVVHDTDWEGAVLVGYTTGMRLQDVTNLRWSSVDVENGVVSFVQRKADDPALVGLHDDLRDWITRQVVPDDPEAYLFPTLANRPGAGRKGLCKAFQDIMEKAGVLGRILRAPKSEIARTVRSLSFHSFRHGAATAVFKGAALKDIARRVTAHSSRGVLDRYIRDDIEAIRQATHLIPRLPKAQGLSSRFSEA